ncbi:TPA: bifunctional transaldolase/phosoglucose isomerase [Candidatus Poribacteria bacterium]|nr:bifunctional transaldolase/phosoglucose isomerase [Candidatus Poribacteria bacterium]
MTNLHKLANLGQAIWLDYIRRSLITSGELQTLIGKGLRGVTSNPTIFEKAIAGSSDYDEDLQRLVSEGKSVEEIYEDLVIEDIARAADLLCTVYDATDGVDGYVSIEANPKLANDTDDTVDEIHHLYAKLERPNVMYKIPATPAGISAIQSLIGEGININVTLIFSLAQYEAVAEAYIAGLEKLAETGKEISRVTSVASFFVSRVDVAVDRALDEIGNTELKGKIAIANSKVAYARFRELFSGERWKHLSEQGARVQRVLWASTSAKNPEYPDTLYVDNLIGPDTVNTLPPATLQALLDHGRVASTIETNVEEAHTQLAHLAELGVDLDAITEKLLDDGVAAFAKSFESLMASITEKRNQLRTDWRPSLAKLGAYQTEVDKALADIKSNRIINRIWEHDHTVWKPEPTEISNRLGWLHITEVMSENIQGIRALVDAVREEGYTHVLLLGMGGSSLAPEVFRKTFGVKDGHLDLAVLDSTDPGAVLAYAEQLDLSRTLFIVSSKSGATLETLSFFKFFYNRVDKNGGHFIAITDPNTPLEALADCHNFRAKFLNDPNIGGRYSALSYFGIVPAMLIGVDVATLLDRATTMMCNCEGCNCPVEGDNAGAWLGAVIGELAKAGRDKLTIIASPPISSFGTWLEQLIAESTGKEGKGILPVDGETLGPPDIYGDDRLFVYLRLDGDDTYDDAVKALIESEQPVAQFNLKDLYDLGGEFFRWEMATAVAGHILGINPFDQPNVESSKALARQMMEAYQKERVLPMPNPILQEDGITVYADVAADSLEQVLNAFLAQKRTGDYIALQAYLQPTEETSTALQQLRIKLRDHLKIATTVGYGPRFLHSTGQLHKGDAGNGLFIQFTADAPRDLEIPEPDSTTSAITFGTLKMAQALGDRKALLKAGRRVILFHLGKDAVDGLKRLVEIRLD